MLLGAILPTAMGRHLSVGMRDSVGTGADETPDDPTVSEANREIGISLDCYDANGNLSEEELERSRQADPFCGEIVYHENNPDLIHQSTPDQDYRETSEVAIGQFDVVATNVIDVDEFRCVPFCSDDPGGDVAWEAFHTVGETLGITEGPDEADEQNEGPREQAYGASIHYPTAPYVLQQTTDAWDMNGWWGVMTNRNYVAYLYDDNGDPIGDDRLEGIVGNLVENGELHGDTAPVLCGWSPDFEFNSLNFEGTNCEISFEYREPGGGPEGGWDEGYNDVCKSPTWECGGFSGAAWYSRAWCLNCGSNSQLSIGPNDGSFDFVRWHWVLAPHPSECGGTVQPGISFDSDGADHPYLAHDLDVWTHPTDLEGIQDGESFTNVQDFAWEGGFGLASDQVDEATDQAGEVGDELGDTIDMVLETINDTLPGLPPLPSTPDNPFNTSNVFKSDRIEPNANPVGAFQDTSQSLPQEGGLLDRTIEEGGVCQQFLSSGEDSDTVDPWVDIVDSDVHKEVHDNALLGSGLYLNTDEHQDESNHPGPDLYRTDGNVGMFTDKEDEGEYQTLSGNPTVLSTRSEYSLSGDKYDDDNIKSEGAYPMLWDMWVTEGASGDPVVDEGEGCTSVTDTGFATEMKAAGYGPNTTLFQAVYLKEPTTFFYSDTAEPIPYPEGDNIFLFFSQSARMLYEPDQTAANPVDARIDGLVDELKNYAQTQGAAEPDVQVPGELYSLSSDFMGQCFEDTGGFTLEFSFTHDCRLDCGGDTIVTAYTYDVMRDDGTLGGRDAEAVPLFEVDNQAYDFGTGLHAWYDVDPFDNDPDRQDETDSSPPT